MPEFEFPLPTGEPEPLFPANDPLTFTLPDIDGNKHVFRAADKGRDVDDRKYPMDSQPVAWMIEALALQCIDDDQEACRRHVGQMFEDNILEGDSVRSLLQFLNDERAKAKKKQAKRKLGRPTTEPVPSGS